MCGVVMPHLQIRSVEILNDVRLPPQEPPSPLAPLALLQPATQCHGADDESARLADGREFLHQNALPSTSLVQLEADPGK